ncbi:hypothetical protein J0X19_11805 [Hymenobacter sp. BT186]|uniref:Tail fiber protein n=1 Tax=Hymenobacter telluris TaxID=2816474 RepID=A0A939JDR7_9BACT|nr:hypothetical protein [Hymenobacter telluris]MBO0358632.1 hypothetical protein [Hymenobacter telluris]MBW3374658.1 hypothetical protein [Hymenobacter norwichensis]
MTQLLPAIKARFLDANGKPLAGGKVFAYAAGTSTLKDTYTDSAGDTANFNPVILDSRGYADIWLGQGDYKIVVLDANDVLQLTIDNVAGDSAQGFASKVFSISTNTNITESYDQAVLVCTGSLSLNLLAADMAGEGFAITIINAGTAAVIIEPNGAETINEAENLTLDAGSSALLACDGDEWFTAFSRNSFSKAEADARFATAAQGGKADSALQATTQTVLQQVEEINLAKSTTTAIIPLDNTIPQSNEGIEFMAVTITPKKIGSKIVPRFYASVSGTNGTKGLIGSIYMNNDANAIATAMVNPSDQTFQFSFMAEAPAIVTTSLTPITFRFRYGIASIGTSGTNAYINRGSQMDLFGNAAISKFTATEYA